MIEKRDRIAAICAQHGVDIEAAALQLCAAHRAAAAATPGSKTPGKVAENARLMTVEIAPELWSVLRRQGLLSADVPAPGDAAAPHSSFPSAEAHASSLN